MNELQTSTLSTPIKLNAIARGRSARRLRYEARTAVVRQRLGELEDIRKKLGMRPAQICELLKVHPSAWIRWTRNGGHAPPHIYQMLEWYLELQVLKGTDPASLTNPPAHVTEERIFPAPIPTTHAPLRQVNDRRTQILWILAVLQAFSLGAVAFLLIKGRALFFHW